MAERVYQAALQEPEKEALVHCALVAALAVHKPSCSMNLELLRLKKSGVPKWANRSTKAVAGRLRLVVPDKVLCGVGDT